MTQTDARSRVLALADRLQGEGALPADWRGSFLRVPRHWFIPAHAWVRDGDEHVPVSRASDPAEWWSRVYSDVPIVTQMDDGATAPGETGDIPSSSASMPALVLGMLDALDVRDGHRVLEVGTGTGYNAALLSDRVGESNVTSVELDPVVAGAARHALHAAGIHPRVIAGDGAGGYAPHAPYDRVIATCAVQTLPYAWVEQIRPGGVIVTPWETAYGDGVLLRLTVEGDGTARGRVVGDSDFMWLRSQRVPRPRWAPRDSFAHATEIATSTTTLNPDDVFHNKAADFLVGAAVPDCQTRVCDADDDSGEFTVWLYDPVSESGACVDYEPGTVEYTVEQHGPIRLWDVIESTYRWWIEAGRPERERFGVTVTPAGQQVWLDQPRHVVPLTA